MAMNKFMHPRNPYRTPPSFKQLAIEFPEFRKHVSQDLSGKIVLDFKNDGAVWALTQSLLARDFGLTVETVPNRLAPTLPLRLNYLLWIEDLLKANGIQKDVIGIDIGTGACCIYPLLARKHFNWDMIGTEVDQENYDCATSNVTRNNLSDNITVKKVEPNTYLRDVVDPDKTYTFSMCNPPFHNLNEESKSRTERRSGPRNAPTGSTVELAAHGGEVSFVTGIIDDSIHLKDKIRIYTVMLGHKTSLKPLKRHLEEKKACQVTSTMFCQGRTTRWGLAWTFEPTLNLVMKPLKPTKPPASYAHAISLTDSKTFASVVETLKECLNQLKVELFNVLESSEKFKATAKATSNTWINSRRKRREEKLKLHSDPETTNEKTENGSKRKRDESPGLGGESVKKLKTEPDDVYLLASLLLTQSTECVLLELTFIEGQGGKDATYQLLLFLKNRL